MKTESPIKRRVSRQIHVGDVAVGGDAPISVQSMTNTETCDVAATVAQVRAIQDAGADIVRVSVPSMEAAEAFRQIRDQVTVPLVADIHFDHKIALKVAEYGVDCLRINPGNIGRDDKVREVIDSARDKGIPIRIGVNAGSLGKDLQRKYGEPTAEALVESAMRHVDILDKFNYPDFKVSVKASEVFMAVAAYRLLVLSGRPGRIYNVCSGTALTMSDGLNILLEGTQRPLTARVDPDRCRPSDTPYLVGDSTRLRDETGWVPQHDFPETLRDLLAAARKELA